MKNYKNFILSENVRSDTTIINDPDILVNNIIEKCSNFNIDTDIPIYRGLREYQYGMIINPKKHNRVSLAGLNIYNVIIDGTWIDYPKRSKSLIGTTKKDIANVYGDEVYRIIPFDNAKFTVCPKNDMWYSFSFIKNKKIDCVSIQDYFLKIVFLYKIFVDNYKDIGTILDIDELKQEIDKLENIIKNTEEEDIYTKLNGRVSTKIVQNIIESDNYFNYLVEQMDPVKNDFKLIEYKNLSTILDLNHYSRNNIYMNPRELWTDYECILIREEFVNDIFLKVREKQNK